MCTNRKRYVLLFLICTFGLFVAFKPTPPDPDNIRVIVLDAGHGGKDPGNLGTGTYKTTEKDVTLDVTLKLGAYIKESFPDIKIVYTRDGDTYPTLKDRVKIANDAAADLFISIHCDAFTKSSAHGSSTFVMGMHKTEESLRVAMKENASIFMEDNYQENYQEFDPSDPDTYIALTLRQNIYLDQSLSLSKKIQDQFRDRVGRTDRGVKQAGYYVICFTTMPSVLVELGFLTNGEEEKFLNSEKGKTYMSSAIYRAFKDYKAQIDDTAVYLTPPKQEKPQKEEPVKQEDLPDLNSELTYDKIRKGVKFQVQIFTSSEKLDKSSVDFRGITQVDEYISNGMYKYAVGATTKFDEAKQMQNYLRKHGFPGAFVIAFKDGERVDIGEAIKK